MSRSRSVLEAANRLCTSVSESTSAMTRTNALAGLVAINFVTGVSQRERILRQSHEILRLRSHCPCGDEGSARILLSDAHQDLGCTYLEIEKYDKAEQHLDRSLAIKRQFLSEFEMPFEFATEYEDMAYMQLRQGRTADALRLREAAVRVAKMGENANRSVIFRFIFDWSVVLLNRELYEEAPCKAKEALEGRKRVLGENAVHSLSLAYWVANTWYPWVDMWRQSKSHT